MMNPTITVAMPFFNSGKTLELAIRSLLNQKFGDFELLLCDDGSDDDGVAIAKSFADQRITLLCDGQRRRLPARLNQCIKIAKGRYFARMDGDDVAYPDRLHLQFEYLEQNRQIDLCGGGAIVFGGTGAPHWRYTPVQTHFEIVRSPMKGFPLWHPGWMGRTDWFRRWQYEESAHLGQDQEMLLRSYRTSTFANLPNVLIGYRQERVSLKKLLRYRALWIRYVYNQATGSPRLTDTVQLAFYSTARALANCVAAMGVQGIARQGSKSPTIEELKAWNTLWQTLNANFAGDVQDPFKEMSGMHTAESQVGAQ